MKVAIIAATEREISLLRQSLSTVHTGGDTSFQINFYITGVGILASCFSIANIIFANKPDLVIQAGIAGAFDNQMILGNVIAIENEQVGDAGVVENNVFNDLFDMQLAGSNDAPFTDKKLRNKNIGEWNITGLPMADAITINEITTHKDKIAQMKEKYDFAIESMEGASLHYCCIKTGTPFIQIRAVSNYIGERDKNKWAFSQSFKNLSQAVIGYIEKLKSIQ